jgi:hypothetical protein
MAFKFRSQNNFIHGKTISLSANRRGRLLSTAIQYAHLSVCKKLTSLAAVDCKGLRFLTGSE